MSDKNCHRPPGCENCKKECSIHLTQIIDNHTQKVDMCETCPKAKQLQNPLDFGLMEELMGMVVQAPKTGKKKGKKCPTCGYTEGEFKKTGRLGCADCYKVFLAEQVDLLRKMHRDVTHKGKVPKNRGKTDSQKQINELNKQLKQLVHVEDYEGAAKVRDEILALEKAQTVAPKKKRAPAKKKTPPKK